MKDRLIRQGMSIDDKCTLCEREQETINYLFFGYEFSKWTLKEAMEATGRSSGEDRRFDIVRGCSARDQ